MHCWKNWFPQARVLRQIWAPVTHAPEIACLQNSRACAATSKAYSTAMKRAFQHFAVSSCRLGAAPQPHRLLMGVLPISDPKTYDLNPKP
jgi:hypothetical protein